MTGGLRGHRHCQAQSDISDFIPIPVGVRLKYVMARVRARTYDCM